MKKVKKFLKILVIILIILVIALVAYKAFLFSWSIKLEKKALETLGDNYYYKKVQHTSNSGYVLQTEVWHTNSAIKTVLNSETTDGMSEELKMYDDLENETCTYVYPANYYAYIEQGNSIYAFETPSTTHFPLNHMYYLENNTEFSDKMWYIFSSLVEIKSITTETVDGVECYKIDSISTTVYIDKETNLYVKAEDSIGNTSMYSFSVGSVTAEDVAVPDLSEYEVVLY